MIKTQKLIDVFSIGFPAILNMDIRLEHYHCKSYASIFCPAPFSYQGYHLVTYGDLLRGNTVKMIFGQC